MERKNLDYLDHNDPPKRYYYKIYKVMIEARLAAVNAHFNPKQIKVTVYDKVALVQMDSPTKLTVISKPILEELNTVFR